MVFSQEGDQWEAAAEVPVDQWEAVEAPAAQWVAAEAVEVLGVLWEAAEGVRVALVGVVADRAVVVVVAVGVVEAVGIGILKLATLIGPGLKIRLTMFSQVQILDLSFKKIETLVIQLTEVLITYLRNDVPESD